MSINKQRLVLGIIIAIASFIVLSVIYLQFTGDDKETTSVAPKITTTITAAESSSPLTIALPPSSLPQEEGATDVGMEGNAKVPTDSVENYAYLDDPSKSDLPIGDFNHLREYGTKVIVARLTGEGREQVAPFADIRYYGQPRYRNIQMIHIGAYTINNNPDKAMVYALWQGDDLTNKQEITISQRLKFERVNGTWQPAN